MSLSDSEVHHASQHTPTQIQPKPAVLSPAPGHRVNTGPGRREQELLVFWSGSEVELMVLRSLALLNSEDFWVLLGAGCFTDFHWLNIAGSGRALRDVWIKVLLVFERHCFWPVFNLKMSSVTSLLPSHKPVWCANGSLFRNQSFLWFMSFFQSIYM